MLYTSVPILDHVVIVLIDIAAAGLKKGIAVIDLDAWPPLFCNLSQPLLKQDFLLLALFVSPSPTAVQQSHPLDHPSWPPPGPSRVHGRYHTHDRINAHPARHKYRSINPRTRVSTQSQRRVDESTADTECNSGVEDFGRGSPQESRGGVAGRALDCQLDIGVGIGRRQGSLRGRGDGEAADDVDVWNVEVNVLTWEMAEWRLLDDRNGESLSILWKQSQRFISCRGSIHRVDFAAVVNPPIMDSNQKHFSRIKEI